jgi:peptide/nickel transport system substrate-binding protein/oligopeptide transport system substrate-binding protein
LATSYTVSDDGLTYTFTIRDGVKWVDSQQREYADVTAYDFVAGMQHMLDAAGGLEYLVEGIIVNASEYIAGTVTDFSEVGVKALDEHTLVYTLESPCTYFTTLLGYSVFAPLCESYYKSQGGKFGSEYDAAADGYTYGTDSDHILYCGPYVVTNATANNTIVFSANQTYWNKDNINVHTITWLFTDSSDPTKTYTDMQAGILSGCGLNSSALEIAKSDGWFDQYAYVTTPSMTTYVDYINLHRVAYANYNDETKVVSTMTDEQKIRTNLAVLNVHFRNALNFSVDRGLLNAQTVGDELKYVSVRNSYTPGNFVSLEEDTTVEINGVATTFAKGTYYGEIMQAQLTADGSTIQVWDSTANDGIGSGDGFDGWYNPTAAAEELAKAVEELAAEGVEISAENPIYIDYPYPSNVTAYVNQANAYKQSVESATGGKIVVNLVACADYLEWYYSGYYPSTGEGMNYTVSSVSGWGPDYGDPSTYLDTLLPDGAGYVTSSLGIY